MQSLSAVARPVGILEFGREVNRAMRWLAQDPRTMFVGQSVRYDGAAIYASFDGVPMEKRLEMPVIEDFQLGFCIGLALSGKIPICVYPRLDFMLLAMNQLVNHLDRFCEMGDYRPKVIVRTRIGAKIPLNAGPQHTGDYTQALSLMLRNVRVVKLTEAAEVVPAYQRALYASESTLLIEAPRV